MATNSIACLFQSKDNVFNKLRFTHCLHLRDTYHQLSPIIESYVPLDKSHFNLLQREHNVTSSLILIRIASEQIDMFVQVQTTGYGKVKSAALVSTTSRISKYR